MQRLTKNVILSKNYVQIYTDKKKNNNNNNNNTIHHNARKCLAQYRSSFWT